MKLLTSIETEQEAATPHVLQLANDADPLGLAHQLQGVERIDLNFPKFTDGRAFSQAWLLRRRLGYQGAIRATGDVLIDQLVQMQRSGFSEALLRADQDAEHGQRLLSHYDGFYQGDIQHARPRFAQPATGYGQA